MDPGVRYNEMKANCRLHIKMIVVNPITLYYYTASADFILTLQYLMAFSIILPFVLAIDIGVAA